MKDGGEKRFLLSLCRSSIRRSSLLAALMTLSNPPLQRLFVIAPGEPQIGTNIRVILFFPSSGSVFISLEPAALLATLTSPSVGFNPRLQIRLFRGYKMAD